MGETRGVFERPPGSGVWWINYYVDKKRHRVKVGTKAAAEKLYARRKAAALEGRHEVKKEPVIEAQVVTVNELIDDVLELIQSGDHASVKTYISRSHKVRAALGALPADRVTPQVIQQFLKANTKTPANSNRYKAFLSLCYREGLVNSKVTSNPARLVRQRKESGGRLRFLSRDEYNTLYTIIEKRFPAHLAEFVASVHTGMRLSEQYSVTWKMVHLDRKIIRTEKSKSNRKTVEGRTIHLNLDAIAAIQSLKRPGQKPSDVVFPHPGKHIDLRTWFPHALEEAGITDYVWHGNRHTFCSWLAMAGATLKEIQELAGHKTITMSARYAHLSPDHKLSVVDRLSVAIPVPTPVSHGHHNSHHLLDK